MCSPNYGSVRSIPQTTMLEGTALPATAYLDPFLSYKAPPPVGPANSCVSYKNPDQAFAPLQIFHNECPRLGRCIIFCEGLPCLTVLDCSIYPLLSDLADA